MLLAITFALIIILITSLIGMTTIFHPTFSLGRMSEGKKFTNFWVTGLTLDSITSLSNQLTGPQSPFKIKNVENNTKINSPYIKEYRMPNGTWPNGILVTKNGLIWTVGTKSNTLISFDPKLGKIKSIYPITEGSHSSDNKAGYNNQSKREFRMTWTMVEDNDGFIWFSQAGRDPLWRFDPREEEFMVVHSISGAPMQMKVDRETGNIWFTTFSSGTIGVIQNENKSNNVSSNTSSGKDSLQYRIKEFNLGNSSFPSGIFLDKQSIWITETLNVNKVVHFKPIADKNGSIINIVKLLELPPATDRSHVLTTPTDLAVLENRNSASSILLAEHGTNFFTRYNINSNTVERYPTSVHPPQYVTLPYWIRLGSNNNTAWFNEHTGNRIAMFNVTDRTLTEYEIPTRDPHNGYIANALTLAIDLNDSNKVWFTEFNEDKIGFVDHNIPIFFNIYLFGQDGPVLILGDREEEKRTGTIILNVTTRQKIEHLFHENNSTLFLTATSSMTPLTKFANMTAKFLPTRIIDPAKIKDETLKLILQTQLNTPPGNYTVGISASDGTVIKTSFLDLAVKK